MTNSLSETSSGGVFYIKRAKSLSISQASIAEAFTPGYQNGSFIYSESENIEVQITNTTIVCDSSAYYYYDGESTNGGAIYIANSNS